GSMRVSNQRNIRLFSCCDLSKSRARNRFPGANPFSFVVDRGMRYRAIVPKRWLSRHRWARREEMATMTETAGDIESRKSTAEAWFQELRDTICKSFETLEADLPPTAQLGGEAPGRFVQ